MSQERSQFTAFFKKRIKAADTCVFTQYFYNSDCVNITSVHRNLNAKKRNCERYTDKKGSISRLIKHRKGKSSSKRENVAKSQNIHVSNRFAVLQHLVEKDSSMFESNIRKCANKTSLNNKKSVDHVNVVKKRPRHDSRQVSVICQDRGELSLSWVEKSMNRDSCNKKGNMHKRKFNIGNSESIHGNIGNIENCRDISKTMCPHVVTGHDTDLSGNNKNNNIVNDCTNVVNDHEMPNVVEVEQSELKCHSSERINLNDTEDIIRATKNGSKCIKKVNVEKIVNPCTDLKKLLSQQEKPFGFLPISNLCYRDSTSSTPTVILTNDTFDPIQLHERVFASGTYNFLGEKIQLPSKINFQK